MAEKWLDSMMAARAAEDVGDYQKAEMLFDHAIYDAQRDSGAFNAGLADCLSAYAKFLENRKRFTEAMFRYKLASAIHQRLGNTHAYVEAEENVMRMQHWASLEFHADAKQAGQTA